MDAPARPISATQTETAARPPLTWSRFRYPDTLISFGIQLAVLVFIAYSAIHLDVRFERLAGLSKLQPNWTWYSPRCERSVLRHLAKRWPLEYGFDTAEAPAI